MSSLLLCKIDFGLFFLLDTFIFLFFHIIVLGGTLMVLLMITAHYEMYHSSSAGRFLGMW